MIKKKLTYRTFKMGNILSTGEPIEIKIRRILKDGEPITDSMPIKYEAEGESDSINDIRRDKWTEAEMAKTHSTGNEEINKGFKVEEIAS